MFKIRDVILKRRNEYSKISRFALVPLYERLRPKDSEGAEMNEIPYQITGVQLMLKCMETDRNSTAFINFRNLLNDQKFEVSHQNDEINYTNRLTLTKTKIIE